METPEVVLLLLLVLQTSAMVYSVIRLVRYRDNYPVKQLSPRVTIMIAVALWLASLMLAIVQFKFPGPKPQPTENTLVFVCCLFYNFLREVTVIGFVFRCTRICIAYYKSVDCRPVLAVFRSEVLICALACTFSLILPVVQLIQKYSLNQPGEPLSEFFHFFSGRGARSPFSYVLWGVDNGMYVLVMLFSIRVTNKFRFVGSLMLVYILVHTEHWYKLIWVKLNGQSQESMEQRFYFLPTTINLMCTLVLVYPTLRPTFELPLPTQVIITNHNMLFQYDVAYRIIYAFARYLECTSQSEEESERRTHACRYLQVYTQLIVARREVARNNVEHSHIDNSEAITRDFIEKFVVPNFNDLELLQSTTRQLFVDGRPHKDSIKDGLSIQDLTPLNGKLLRVMNYIYREWMRTKSKQALSKELEANKPIITKMLELQIGITE